MNPRFHLDQDVFSRLKELLNTHYDDPDCVRTAVDLGLHRALDGHHLLVAAQAGRIFVTHNGIDFITMHDAWMRWSSAWRVEAAHAGILIIPQLWGAARSAVEIARFLGPRTVMLNEIYSYDMTPAVNRWVQNPQPR